MIVFQLILKLVQASKSERHDVGMRQVERFLGVAEKPEDDVSKV